MTPSRMARHVASLVLAILMVAIPVTAASAAVTGTVDVAAGNTLKIRSAPNTSATVLSSLADGATVSITCKTTGTTVTGTFGTTNQWDKIGSGYASHAYLKTTGTIPSCTTTTPTTPTGVVDVAAGSTLKVRSAPNTTATVLSSLADGATVSITCKTTGTTVTGTFGTTNQWDKIGSGYASHAYLKTTGTIPNCTTAPPPPPAGTKVQQAINYGMTQIGTIYVGCAAGSYRLGVKATSNLNHDGRTCGQSRVYFQPAGTVGYDCSGLMYAMWKAAGVNLAYTSSSSIKANVPAVSKSSIKAGDMLAKDGHVAMFIGNNQVIESTPYAQNANGSWLGTRVTSASSYLSSTAYTAHRMPGM